MKGLISRYWKLQLVMFLATNGMLIHFFENYILAQINADTTLESERSVVTKSGDSYVIEGGATRGTNLFHSFEQFSVPSNAEVYFNNSPTIQNIISRVTGSSTSNIDGTIRVQGTTNLFLLNPNGIIFGSNAMINAGGSFIVSTANSLNFTDSTQFSTTTSPIAPLLTMSIPFGLQFGRDAKSIVVQGSSLAVLPNRTLGLLGGDVILEGGFLQAGTPDIPPVEGGRIELGSVGANSLVNLNPTEKGWILGYGNVQNYQNVRLTQGIVNGIELPSLVDASGEDGGEIQVQARRVTLTKGSQISAVNLGSSSGGNLTVHASELVELDGKNTGLSTLATGTGRAGNIVVNTRKLLVLEEAVISTDSGALGNLGQITPATGSGGNLIVTAPESVELSNGGLFARTVGSGDGGNITIDTGNLVIQKGSQLTSVALQKSTGKGGNISVNARDLSILNEGLVSVSSEGTGDAGNLEVTARSVSLENGGKLTATIAESGKSGGNINLRKLNKLLLRNNSEISTSAQGSGNGGNINIDTDLLIASENSKITANAVKGQGGNIKIATQGLFVSPNSKIDASSEEGIDGVVEINRPETEPRTELIDLPVEIVDVRGLVAQGCSTGRNVARGASKFVVTGRGGLPPTPTEAVKGDTTLADLGTAVPSQKAENRASAAKLITQTNSSPTPLVEAQGWVIGSQGEVVLTAQAPTVTLDIPWLKSTTCHGS